MPYEMLVGIHITDHQVYALYRASVTPILERYSGGFRYDFVVEQTLKQEVSHQINRVFVISFPDEDHKKQFFADLEYQAVRKQFFDQSVIENTIIARYSL
jgi:uncharacterized protein (DUF1330 family)